MPAVSNTLRPNEHEKKVCLSAGEISASTYQVPGIYVLASVFSTHQRPIFSLEWSFYMGENHHAHTAHTCSAHTKDTKNTRRTAPHARIDLRSRQTINRRPTCFASGKASKCKHCVKKMTSLKMPARKQCASTVWAVNKEPIPKI